MREGCVACNKRDLLASMCAIGTCHFEEQTIGAQSTSSVLFVAVVNLFAAMFHNINVHLDLLVGNTSILQSRNNDRGTRKGSMTLCLHEGYVRSHGGLCCHNTRAISVYQCVLVRISAH